MKKILLLGLLCSPLIGFTQYNITINAKVIDENTREPIPYANVEFLDTSVSEITQNDGSFQLTFAENAVDPETVFKVSAFGYEPQDIDARNFYRFLTNTNKIFLREKGKGVWQTSMSDNPNSEPAKKSVFGRITVQNIPVQGAKIGVKNSLSETITDPSGRYAIEAKPGDVLEVKFLGMVNQEVAVEGLGQVDVSLESDGELLEEVFIQNLLGEKPKVELGYNGKKNFDEITYSAGVIPQNQIRSHYYQLSDLFNGRISKTTYSRNGSINVPSSYIYDIDGMIYTSEADLQLPLIDPQMIESITILNSLSATHKYGTLGRNGVIVMRTKATGYDKSDTKKTSALVEGNNYDESVKLIEGNHGTNLGKFLLPAESFEEAKSLLEKYVNSNKNLGIDFYMDAANYFQKWNEDYALDILEEIESIGSNNTKALRALAFKYDELKEYDRARQVLQRIAVISPLEAQTYMDLARVYKQTGNYQKALDLLKIMMTNKRPGIDFTGLKNSIENEIQHILAFHRTKVDYFDLPNDLRSANFNYDVRVVCEWNDPYTEFKMQFVNPTKKYFTWHYSKLENTQRMLDGVTNGYSMEEFVIDEANPGKWIVNISSSGESTALNPTYLKYTVYKNYGLPGETRDTRVVKLDENQTKVTLDSFVYE